MKRLFMLAMLLFSCLLLASCTPEEVPPHDLTLTLSEDAFLSPKDSSILFLRHKHLDDTTVCRYGLYEKDGRPFALFYADVKSEKAADAYASLLRTYQNRFPFVAFGKVAEDQSTLFENVVSIKRESAENGQLFLHSASKVFQKDDCLGLTLLSVEKPLDFTRPVIALTYDDGPSKNSKALLAILKKHQAKATFYLLGDKAREYPEPLLEAFAEGHEIGNHSNLHENFSHNTPSIILKSIHEADNKIKSVIGITPATLRTPGGVLSDRNGKAISFDRPCILWSIDTFDYTAGMTADGIVEQVMKNLSSGAIVLLHGTHDVTLEATDALLPLLHERGYQTVTVSELLEFYGEGAENGIVYRGFS